MSTPTSSPLFDEVAEAARERIREDARHFAGDPAMLALFEILERRIFDPALDVNGLLAAGDVSRETRDRFVARFGSLKRYLDRRRVEAAMRLLRATDWRVGEVGRRVGYDVLRTFQRTCQRVTGKSPSELRQEETSIAREEPTEEPDAEPDAEPPDAEPPDAEPDGELPLPALAARWRRRVTLGLDGAGQLAELRRLLRERYPGLCRDRRTLPAWVERPVYLLKTGDELEVLATSAVLEKVLAMDDAAQRHALVHGLRFQTETNVFHLLRETAQKLLWSDRGQAVKLAERTVEMVDAHAGGRMNDAGWQALAWASLAELRLGVRDLAGADQAITFARAEWTASRQDPHVEADICRHEAALRRLQRRYDEAVHCLDRALEISAATAHEPFHVLCRLDRAELALLVEDPGTCFEMLKGITPEVFRKTAARNLAGRVAALAARAAAMRGDDAKAEACYRQVRRIFVEPSFHGAESLRQQARFAHRTGRLDEAEALFRQARDEFEAIGAPLFQAAARAELAALRDGDRQAAERAELADVFESLPLHREARIVARILRSIDGPCDGDDLAELRRGLDLVIWEVPAPLRPAGEEGST